MKKLVAMLMGLNAALFFFGAIQHAGVVIGPFHEPVIVPAAIVETICGISLISGIIAIFGGPTVRLRGAIIANLIPLAGVLLGQARLAAGAGPRTTSNDLYHRIMLILIVCSLVILFTAKSRRKPELAGNQ